LLQGTSRRILPGLLDRIGPIDLFVHDSLHTERNLRFELSAARKALSPGGAVVADDVQRNGAFARFVAETDGLEAWVAAADDARSQFGVALLPDARGATARSS
jgi:predicted O-methyltransferase YrrM